MTDELTLFFLVVSAEERVVGIYRELERARRDIDPTECIFVVTEQDLEDAALPLFYLPKLADYNPIQIQELSIDVEAHDQEISELFQRVGSVEEDLYGEERAALQVTADMEDGDDLN